MALTASKVPHQNHSARASYCLNELNVLLLSAINVFPSKPLCRNLQAEEEKMLPLFLFPRFLPSREIQGSKSRAEQQPGLCEEALAKVGEET